MPVPKLTVLLTGFVLLAGVWSSVVGTSYAQTEGNSTSGPNYQNGTTIQSPQGAAPVLEKKSDKGYYLVELQWNSFTLNPKGEMNIQVHFLNASSPFGNSTNVPQRESNYSGYASGPNKTAQVVPSIIERPLTVNSYDFTVYDNKGHVLWQQKNLPSDASTNGPTVTLGNYTGPVTIAITNITASPGALGTTTASNSGAPVTDSVTFNASVAPEFPIATVSLAAGLLLVSSMIVIPQRLRGRQNN